MPKRGKMDIYFNDKQFVRFIIDPDFYAKYGDKQYALYECVAVNDMSEHYASIYLPDNLSDADLAGTLAHEVSRLADDVFQTAKATLIGEVVTEFWREYE